MDTPEVNDIPTTNERHDKQLAAAIFLAVISVLLAVGVFSFINNIMSYEPKLMLSLNGREVGFVSDISTVYSVRNSIESEVSKAVGADYKLDFDVSYTIKLTKGEVGCVGYDTVYEIMSSSCGDMVGDAYSLYIGDTYIASAHSEEELNKAVENIKNYCNKYVTENSRTAKSATVTTHFEIVPDRRVRSSLMTADSITAMFKAPSAKKETVTLSVRDDLSVLTSQSASSLSGADNTEKPDENARESIRLNFSKEIDTSVDYGFSRVAEDRSGSDRTDMFSLLTYDVISYETYTEIVPFTIEHVKSPYYYDGLTFKSAEGSDGIIENIYEVVTRNGEVISSTLYETNVISEMQPETYTIGTKEPPPAKATGTFLWPLQNDFMISSVYGLYRGKFDGDGFHYGLDMTGEIGDYIFAADGGEVIFAGKRSTYGIVVIIQHDSHLKTYYAHMNQAFVETGEMVYPGQLIGEIGMTGLTTGPHLHFEIRKDSYPVDPMDYMPEH